MKKNFYTYAWLRKDGTPYYVGKGKGDRAFSLRRGRLHRPSDRNLIRFLKKNLTEEEAFKHEIYMIFVLGRKDLGTGLLRNRTSGGEGTSGYPRIISEEQKLKISESLKGIPRPTSKVTGKENITQYHERRKRDPTLQDKFLKMVSENGKRTGKKTGHLNKGRKHSPEINAKKASPGDKNPMFGKVRITNGVINTQVNRDDPLPEGFWKGITTKRRRVTPTKDKD